MLFDPQQEEEFRRKQGIEELGSYHAVLLRLGFNFDRLPHFPPSSPEAYGLESLAGLKIYKGRRGGKEILFAPTMVGAAAASFNIERYLCHSPATEGIGVGYCGALQPEMEIGGIVIPSRARIGEGTSRYYGRSEVSEPDQDLVSRLVTATRRFGYQPHVGEIYSTDAPLMETPHFIQELSAQGILGIDMEMSALFSIAAYHGKRAAGILVVSDKPYQGSLYEFYLPPVLEEITEDVIKICIQALTS